MRSVPLLSVRVASATVLTGMLLLVAWASSRCPLFDIPPDVLEHPWFLTTLVDAYLAFLAVYGWIAWKEQSTVARVLWLPALLLWGNVAIAAYVLRETLRLRPGASVSDLITTRRPGHSTLPGLLNLTAIAVYGAAWAAANGGNP